MTSANRRPSFRARRRRPGFTMVEITVGLVISALMVTLAIPRIDTTKYRADGVATIIRTTLQSASRAAILRQHDVIVTFDTLAEKISVIWDQNNNGQINTGERMTTRGLDVGVYFSDPSVKGVSGATINAPISGTTLTLLNGLPALTFHRDGTVSSDAEIYISINARGPKMYRAIVLTQATGREDWYRLNTQAGKWIIAP